jgi:hypothetical protein
MGNFVFPNFTGQTVKRPAKTSISRGQVVFVGEEVTVTAAQLTLNALFGNIYVPKNAVIIGAYLMSTDVDTNGAPAVVLAVGDAGAAGRLITGATIGQAGGLSSALDKAGFAYQYTAETLVQIKVTTAPATAAAGTFTYGVLYVTP